MRLLEGASPEDRAEVYRQLGVSLAYDPAVRQVRVRADLPRIGVRVEGGEVPIYDTRDGLRSRRLSVPAIWHDVEEAREDCSSVVTRDPGAFAEGCSGRQARL